jgi:phosphonate transport system substrate-binding protein
MRELMRKCIGLLLLICACTAQGADSPAPIRIGLTSVFLDDQATFVVAWRSYLETHLQRPVTFVQRGSYREVVDLLREGKLDFAWLCGYPYVRNKSFMRLVAVPLYQGEPLYRAYIIVPASDKKSRSLNDLRGKVFAFSDPDSNSGHLYPKYLLASQSLQPADFFAKTFYTWGHKKVVEAVASGLVQGGAVDGYVWDTLKYLHPELTDKTRILQESPQFGHPPFVAGRSATTKMITDMQQALFHMTHDPLGSQMLDNLNLDGFVYGQPSLFDSIANMSRVVENQRNVASQRR